MIKILIIDDETSDLEIMKSILSKEKYEIATASGGASALDLLIDGSFDLIMIDVKMPTLSGYDLLRLLREKLNHGCKMIYVSIVPEKDVVMDEIDGFVQKPFSPEALIEGVKKVLE